MNRDSKIELLKLLDAKNDALKDKALEDFMGSLIQNEYLCSTVKTAILGGANQSGKTTVGGVDIQICATGIIPNSLKDRYPKSKIQVGGYWVSSLGFKETVEITKPKIFGFTPRRLFDRFQKLEGILSLKTGSEITFKTQEAGEDKYQGAVKRGVWLDEEHKKPVWDECYMRTIALAGWMRMTFTPLKGLTWAYRDLYLKSKRWVKTVNIHEIKEEVGLVHTLEEIEQLKQRRLVIRKNTSSEADPDIEFYIMSIYDNIHLSTKEIQKAERKYKDDVVQYNARILGRFSKLSGRNVFNDKNLLQMQDRCATKFKCGELENGKFVERKNGRLTIFEQPKPVQQGFYVIGADVAEGLENGDYSCAQVLKKGTCEQVAIWHGHISPNEFARVLVDIGRYYNNANLAPERNFHGFAVVNRIRLHFKYRKLYSDYDPADKAVKHGVTAKRGRKKYGWETNRRTRPIMIQDLGGFIEEKLPRINDYQTVEELITFIYDSDGNTGAMGGCYDDRVIALAIALQLYKRISIPQHRDDNLDYKGRVDPTTGY